MITELAVPKYYIKSVDVDVTPTVGETVIGTVGSTFEPSNPALTNDPQGFQCDAELVFNLYERGKTPWDGTDDSTVKKVGDFQTEFRIHIPDETNKIRPYVSGWLNSNDYADVDDEFRVHLESGILQHIITPLGDLLESSYNGIVPRMILSYTRDEPESG